MNSLFETIFEKAKENYLESISEKTLVYDELFTSLERKHKIYRMPYFSKRRYFTVNKGQPYLMTGLTSICKKIQKMKDEDESLTKWKLNITKEGDDPEELAFRFSEFGTLIHIIAGNLFSARAKGESFNTVGIDRMLLDYMRSIGISGFYFKEWYTNLCKAILSLNNFYNTSEMTVFGVEYCVPDFGNNIATPLDIICEITSTNTEQVPNKTKEGTKPRKIQKRERWNLNIKARSNPERRDSDKYQVCAEQYMFNKYLPSEKVIKTGVLSPSWSWRKRELADCKLHDFTDKFSEEDWTFYLNVFKNEPNLNSQDLFNPDLSQRISDSNVFSVNEFGAVSFSDALTIESYIMSYFDK